MSRKTRAARVTVTRMRVRSGWAIIQGDDWLEVYRRKSEALIDRKIRFYDQPDVKVVRCHIGFEVRLKARKGNTHG